ncbi:MAG: hypothetical protein FWE71_13180 [Nocardioidaceae bacterium]|nr:hypothetical protein [Nocardioidaceae bacterium]MCL2613901.1 hypothetical protein [Nocardioidaceae bacterium]
MSVTLSTPGPLKPAPRLATEQVVGAQLGVTTAGASYVAPCRIGEDLRTMSTTIKESN